MSSLSRLLALAVLASATAAFAAAGTLRVCADPNNLPWSNRQQQGFENHLADMIAGDFGEKVDWVWFPQRSAFFRKTLDAGICDVVMGVPAGFRDASVTRPYYVSSYAFLSRRDRHLHLTGLDDPQLRHLRIGVHILGDQDDSLPPVNALIHRGIVHNLVGYSIFGHLDEKNPSADLIQAVIEKRVDVAVVWGPLAGYFSRHSPAPLVLTPIESDPQNPSMPMSFAIGIGVRPADQALRRRLDAEIVRRRSQIHRLLVGYGIPQVSPPPAMQGGN
jgi:mxaJ protein